jgi:hypothetical protein
MSPPIPAREDIAGTERVVPPRAVRPSELMPPPSSRTPPRSCRKCERTTGPWAGLDLCVACLRVGLAARKAEREAAEDDDQDDDRDRDDELDAAPAPVRGELPTPVASFVVDVMDDSIGGGAVKPPRRPYTCGRCGGAGHSARGCRAGAAAMETP